MEPIIVDVPRHGGLIVPIQVWESDHEGETGEGGRNTLLREFAAQYGEETDRFRSQFLDAIGEAVLPDWKLATVDAYAYKRGYLTRTARLAKFRKIDRWIEAGASLNIKFNKTPSTKVVIPALEPPIETQTLLPGGNVTGLAVGGDGTLFASVAPKTNQANGQVHVLGQHLEPNAIVTPAKPPRSVAVDPIGKHLYVITANDGVTMYDTATLQPMASAALGFGVIDVAVDPGSGLVWVSRWRVAGGEVFVLRAGDLSQVAVLTEPDGFHGPLGIAADPDGTRAYVARSFRSGGPGGPIVSGYAVIFQGPDGDYGIVPIHLEAPLVQPVDIAVDAPAELGFVAGLGGPNVVPPQLLIFNRPGVPTLRGRVQLPGNAGADDATWSGTPLDRRRPDNRRHVRRRPPGWHGHPRRHWRNPRLRRHSAI